MNAGYRVVGILLLTVGLFGCKPRERAATPHLARDGVPAGAFSIPSLQRPQERIELSSFTGRVVLLDFWATWCPPCRYELPELTRLYNELKDRGFVIVGMTVDEGPLEQVAAAARRFDLPYPVGWADARVRENYGGIRAVPTKFLLDRKGRVRQQYVGVVSPAQLRADIEALLNESGEAAL